MARRSEDAKALGRAFVEVVARRRRARGMTARDFAKRAGMSQAIYYRFERCVNVPAFDLQLRIAKTMGVPLWRLMWEAQTLLAARTPSQPHIVSEPQRSAS